MAGLFFTTLCVSQPDPQVTALSYKASPILSTLQLCSLKCGLGEERYWHLGELVRKAESQIYRIKICIFTSPPGWVVRMLKWRHTESWNALGAPFHADYSQRLILSHFISASTPQINNWAAFVTSVDSSRAKENHSSCLSCFLIDYCCRSRHFQLCQQLLSPKG